MQAKQILLALGLLALIAGALAALLVSQTGPRQRALAASGCADLDGNGVVQMIDAVIVSDHFDPTGDPTPVKQVDMNKDGIVDLPNDILVPIIQLGTSTSCQTNTPLPKTTLVDGALAVDAVGESTNLSDTVQTKRPMLVGVPFEVSVHITSNPGAIIAYGVRLHWDEALLDLNPRNAKDNDRWQENVGGGTYQILGPNDDGTGSEAYIEVVGLDFIPGNVPPWSGTGPTAQFEFTYQALGTASITLTNAGSHSVLLGRPATEYTPTLANAQINCVTVLPPTATPTSTPTPTVTPTPTITPTPTPKVGPKMFLNVKGGICDDPVNPTVCQVAETGTFTVSVNVTEAPATGYTTMQTFIRYGNDFAYQKGVVGDEIVWPDNAGAELRGQGSQSVHHGGTTGLTPPLPVSNFEGNVVELTFTINCPPTSSGDTLELLPYLDPGAGINGSLFVLPDESQVAPKLDSLKIDCGLPPKLPHPGDSDGDGCSDQQENGGNETLGGLRDYLNPNDFYDVLGPGAALPKDKVIDLPNDILGVILHFSPSGAPPYDVQFDRGPSPGPNPWNMTAPDGVIDLPNDILGVIMQFNHDCR